jgi:hypothetical protein
MTSLAFMRGDVSLLLDDPNILFEWTACQLERTEPYTKRH